MEAYQNLHRFEPYFQKIRAEVMLDEEGVRETTRQLRALCSWLEAHRFPYNLDAIRVIEGSLLDKIQKRTWEPLRYSDSEKFMRSLCAAWRELQPLYSGWRGLIGATIVALTVVAQFGPKATFTVPDEGTR